MAIVNGWLPPTRDNYEAILLLWKYAYPIMSSAQWLTSYYPMGKTSTPSIFNIPGRIAWATMELPGPLTLAYTMHRLLADQGSSWNALPWQNTLLAGLFLLHYAYRAVLYPLLQPSIAPIHALVWLCAVLFQLCNATCLASWLASYGPVSASEWPSLSTLSTLRFAAGVALFLGGLAGNFFHDEELRQIRRGLARQHQNQQRALKENKNENKRQEQDKDKAQAQTQYGGRYAIPQAGLFKVVLFPHYLCEWIEWLGFWVAAGTAEGGCVPARTFLQNEVLAMLPRAVSGRAWYIARFGEEKLGGRRAIIPGLL